MMCIVCLFGCGGNNASEKYTYSDLDDMQKQIIDGVYSQMNDWDDIYDSGKNISVSKVKFIYEDSKILFLVFHPYGGTNGGSIYVYEVNTESGELMAHTYDLMNETDRMNKRTVLVQATFGEDFDVDASEDTQKDVLANSYLKLIREN